LNRYFFYIRYLPEVVNCEFLAGKCIRILHAFQSRFELRSIGVAFPEWSASSIGTSIAFVSESERSLAMLRTQHYFTRMVEEGYFALSDILLVPIELGVPEVIYYRERRLEKETAAAKKREFKRLQNRAISRGVEYKPKESQSKESVLPLSHLIPFCSSSGRVFNLCIGRLDCNQLINDQFSSYGLGNRVNMTGSVPGLAPFIKTL